MTASRSSTTTVGREGSYIGVPEEYLGHLLEDDRSKIPSKRLIIAVDFGTTYSAISYTALDDGELTPYLSLNQIHSVQNFPEDYNLGGEGDRMKSEVPTEVIYPLDPHFRKKEGPGTSDEEEPDEHMADANGNGSGDGDGAAFNDLDIHPMFVPADDAEADSISIDEPTSFRWGYEVHEACSLPATHSDPANQALSRFKLLLDNSLMTENIRQYLKITLDELKRRRIIKNHRDVIVDYLTCLLRHAKRELKAIGLDEGYRKEFVLCVPAIWTQKACRDMQVAMAKALERTAFDGVDVQNNSIENLFIVSEPEAAAAYILAIDRHISPGDTFVILDAGGGTVDANTYTVSATSPLRLTREVVPPGGGLYGSSYLNEGLRDLLHGLLKDETYLEVDGTTINGHIERILMVDFEYRLKRTFDYTKAKGSKGFSLPGLRDNPQKRFKRGTLQISTDEIKNIFLKILEGIASLMEDQINAAMAKGVRVEKVLLIGGFAASSSLKTYLERRLEQFCRENNCAISFFRPENCNTAVAVASGAVLRAFNKEQGPMRHSRSSYGILRTELHNPGAVPEHIGIKPSYDRHDGLPSVVDTVDWILKLGREVPPVWTCQPFPSSHTFNYWPPQQLICKEVLYVSDRSTRSHYQLKHLMNAGAEKVGEIVVDFDFLRHQNLIVPIEPQVNEKGKKIGRRHYRVKYTIVIKVVDRDLQCFAIYEGKIMKKCMLNIASAFSPGVK